LTGLPWLCAVKEVNPIGDEAICGAADPVR
jgi:hypothetical protein